MLTMLRIELDTQATNEAIAAGTIEKTMRSLLDRTRPEAQYHGVHNGVRTTYLFFDLDDVASIAAICEPLFTALRARVELHPVMSHEDLGRGLARIDAV